MDVQLTDLPAVLQALFTTHADDAARAAGLIRRRRKVTPAALAQGLVFGWLQDPTAGSAALLPALARAGLALTPQALDARFTPPAADFFRLLLDKAVGRFLAPPSRPLGILARFNGVHLTDSTSIPLPPALAAAWPSSGGNPDCPGTKAGLKALVRLDVSAGAITGLTLHPARVSDARAAQGLGPTPAGGLRVADLAFAGLDALDACVRAKAHYLTRVKGTSVVYGPDGRRWKLARYLARQRSDRVDHPMWLGEGKKLKGRLLAVRAPEAVAGGRRRAAVESARDHGKVAREETLSVCGWTVLFTDVPRWVLTLQEAWVVYRVRWQIELVFKGFKSDARVDESASADPDRVLCEVLAKLLGVVVQQWLVQAGGGGSMGPKSRRAAGRVVRLQVGQVAAALGNAAALVVAVGVVAGMVAGVALVRKRKGRPAAFQTLLDPYNDGLSAEAGQDPRAEPSYHDEGDDENEHPPSPTTETP